MLLLNMTGNEFLVYAVISLLVILWIRWRKKKLRTFQDLGIPGPPPHFIFGNILEINEKGILQCQDEWLKKYGPFVGYFNGLQPNLLIADKPTLKRIFIKDFHLFSDRPEVVPLRVHSFLDHIIPASHIMDNLLLNLKGDEWKRVRSCLSPVFSTNKLKSMIPFVDQVIEETLRNLEEKARLQETVDIYPLLQYITLDVISAQAFAVYTNIQNERENSEIFQCAKTIFNHPLTSKILIFGYSFPELAILGMALTFLKMFFASGFSIPPLKITNLVGKVIEQRRKNPEIRQPDLLQHLIDASNAEIEENNRIGSDADAVSKNVLKADGNTSKKKRKTGLSDVEIKANSLVVFLAGYETTSSALACAFHMLTKYPEYQIKIQKEIDRFAQGKELDLNVLNNLQFMERFLMESMRFYPPAPTIVNRRATQDVDFGYLRIPKGLNITVPVHYMHFNAENWENPKIFDPDRFLLENRSQNDISAFWAFGNGPRNCIGTRLTSITSKVILLKLLQKFSFMKPDTLKQEELKMIVRHGSRVPENVLVTVRERIRT